MMRLDLMAFCGLTWKRGVEKRGGSWFCAFAFLCCHEAVLI
jgi:hypothetical protein